MRQHPGHGSGDAAGRRTARTTWRSRGRAVRPVPPGDGLDDHQADVLALHLVDERLVGRAVGASLAQHDVHRRQHRRERVPAQRLEVGGGASCPCPVMPTAPTSPSSCARSAASSAPSGPVALSSSSRSPTACSWSRSTWSVCSRSRDALICRQAASRVALAGLGGQEDLVADPRHPRAEPQLGVAVARGDVEVVDARVERLLHRGVGDVLGDVAERRRAVDEHRALVAELAESPPFHVPLPCISVGRCPTQLRGTRSARGCGAGGPAQTYDGEMIRRLRATVCGLAAVLAPWRAAAVTAPQIIVARVARATVTEVVEAPATVTAKATATVSATSDGTVAELRVREGQQVRAGQVLLRIESPSARRPLRQAKAADAEAAVGRIGPCRRWRPVRRSAQADAAARAGVHPRAPRRPADRRPGGTSPGAGRRAGVEAQYAAARARPAARSRSSRPGFGSLSDAVSALSSAQRIQTRAAVEAARRTVAGLVVRSRSPARCR